jgi:hypothetical protein
LSCPARPAVFAFGILVDPVVSNVPSWVSLLNGILLSFVFVAMYMKEYRDTLTDGITSLRSQTARLGESNWELEEALRALRRREREHGGLEWGQRHDGFADG